MRYLSICSGIEAASVAWGPLGWEPLAFSEIESFPSAVLAHHYPDVPNVGDMTKFEEWNLGQSVELLVGGTPCQAFSVAGLRHGLADARGNLTLTFVEMADRFDPEWIVWENVPGVLSSKDNAFGCFLAGLCGADDPLVPDGKWASAGVVSGQKRTVAWRVLDAQYFGVAQRRRRVFVCAVRGAGNWRAAAALFPVGESVFGDTAPRREAGEGITHATAPCLTSSGRGVERTGDTRGQDPVVAVHAPEIARCIATREGSSRDFESTTMVAHSLRGEGFDASEDGTGRGTPLVPVALAHVDAMPTMVSGGSTPASHNQMSGQFREEYIVPTAVAVALRGREGGATAELGDEIQNCLRASSGGGDKPHVLAPVIGWDNDLNESKEQMGTLLKGGDGGRHEGVMLTAMAVRRLTPVECERLQGFPDNYTNISWRKKEESPDGPRYKALGNSMAVPVMNWIGRRIEHVRAFYG